VTLPVAILAGGLASRLRPMTEKTPKALLDIAGKPFVVRQLESLSRQGIERVVLCVGYLGEQIEAAVGDGSAFGLDVRYSWDGPRLLGTSGALRQALPVLGEQFFVYYGDAYLPIDCPMVERAFFASGKAALMTVLRNDGQWDKSNVVFRDGRIIEYNKRMHRPDMLHIDYGMSVLSKSVFEDSGAGRSDLSDIYHALSLRGLLAGLEVFERFYEIGSRAGLEDTVAYFKRNG
jgi:NDP-sugar pyrophosphorylase family protein